MYLFLINPEAGKKRFSSLKKKMEQMLNRYGIKYRFVMVDDLADIPALLEEHLRPTDQGVVAVGGNATVNAVINAIVREDLPLGIVPMSKTNYLAHSLGIKSWSAGIKALANPEFRAERLGKVGKHYFIRKIQLASRQGLLTKYLDRTSPVLRFLGLANRPMPEDGVATQLKVDEDLTATGKTQRLEIELNNNGHEKKLLVHLFVPGAKTVEHSLLSGDSLAIESERKLPVIMGNETVAFTPVEIKGLAKHIRLIVPTTKTSKLTEIPA